MGVEPKIGGLYPPKWMVKIMENPIKMDDLGVPLFLETPKWRPKIYDLCLAGPVDSGGKLFSCRRQLRL